MDTPIGSAADLLRPTESASRLKVEVTGLTKDEEFTTFMRSSGGSLYRAAYLLSGDQHRAEELVQQTLERTYRHWRTAREGDPLVYARRILSNLRIDTWRRTRRETLVDHTDPTSGTATQATPGAPAAETVEARDAVVRALQTLPARQRRIVVLRYMLDLSEAEVAHELDITVGTVKSTASRALARLRGSFDTWSVR